ncbi:MAG: hypothetical protein LGB68_06705 [Sulfurovum sp.]|nr:hypothetical protein [Sulfurovum sp.]MCB4746814.1 hypothetical protein [Sulfurovum sp.]MCB4750203.1 hypothetical protein [Sulfurovum sp.]MCB4751533.1 hypothetical protein [Sulfurovum sp.]MCB4753466.1 hypothetical protein [Sulfurovum sp.]
MDNSSNNRNGMIAMSTNTKMNTPIYINYTVPASTKPGMYGNIDIQIFPNFYIEKNTEENMTVELQIDEDLSTTGTLQLSLTKQQFTLKQNGTHQLHFTATSDTDGLYYIRLDIKNSSGFFYSFVVPFGVGRYDTGDTGWCKVISKNGKHVCISNEVEEETANP